MRYLLSSAMIIAAAIVTATTAFSDKLEISSIILWLSATGTVYGEVREERLERKKES
jgi:hypothetical protein